MRVCVLLLSLAVATALGTRCSSGGSHGSHGSVWRLEEFFRIGSVDDTEVSFTAISDILVDGPRMYVLETQPAQVLQFDRSGNRIRVFGRQGQGPGEFTRPCELGLAHGELWVYDPLGARLELFSQDGEYLRSVRFQILSDSTGGRILPRAILSDGHILAGPAPLSIGGVLSGAIDHLTFLQTDSVGMSLREILRLPISASDFFQASLGEGGMMGANALQEGPLVTVFPNGSGVVAVERWVAEGPDSAAIRISAYASDGSRRFDLELPYRPIQVPDGWMGAFLQRQMARSGQTPHEDQQRDLMEAVQSGISERAFSPP